MNVALEGVVPGQHRALYVRPGREVTGLLGGSHLSIVRTIPIDGKQPRGVELPGVTCIEGAGNGENETVVINPVDAAQVGILEAFDYLQLSGRIRGANRKLHATVERYQQSKMLPVRRQFNGFHLRIAEKIRDRRQRLARCLAHWCGAEPIRRQDHDRAAETGKRFHLMLVFNELPPSIWMRSINPSNRGSYFGGRRNKIWKRPNVYLEQHEPSLCFGGHGREPYEQNTQQSPGFGRS